MASKSLSGAKIFFKINGMIVAWAKGLQYGQNIETIDIEVIDNIEQMEFSENAIKNTFSCTMFRIFKQSVTNLGIMPKIANILSQPDLIVTVHNKVTSELMMIFEGVKLISVSGSLDARSVWQENLQFKCKKMYTEGGE